jgi:hypothetical protein
MVFDQGVDDLMLSQPPIVYQVPTLMHQIDPVQIDPVQIDPTRQIDLPALRSPAKPKRTGAHIMNKLDLNAMSKDKPLHEPSAMLPALPITTRLCIKRVLPLSTPGQLLLPRHQRAYGASDAPMNEYEQVLFELNTFLPLTGILRVGPYSIPLLVLRFVVDKTGRFLVLVTCPWCPNHNVFSLFHFFKNMLHMLHQMDSDDRLKLLRDFGESQVTFFSMWPPEKFASPEFFVLSAPCTRIFFWWSTKPATNSRTRGRTSNSATCGSILFFFCSRHNFFFPRKHSIFLFVRTSYRKVDLSGPGASDLIAKLRTSVFWMALKTNAIGPNPINLLIWPNQMIADVTAAKNAFGHQASDGVCKDGNSGLCVCKQLIARVLEHPAGTTTEGLLRVVATNLPCGIAFNFKEHASTISVAVGALYSSHPSVFAPLENIAALVRKQVIPKKKAKEAKVKKETPPEEEPASKKHQPADRFFYSASIRLLQSRFYPDGVRHTQAGITIGGVDPKQLIAAMHSVFGPA